MCSCFSQGEITVGKLAKLANGSASIKVIGFFFTFKRLVFENIWKIAVSEHKIKFLFPLFLFLFYVMNSIFMSSSHSVFTNKCNN